MRRRLADGILLESLRADAPAGIRIRTDAELDQSLADALRSHDPAEDLHVFGYGSLMWNPAMDVVRMSVARVQGWHRRFCLRMLFGRGTVGEPGAMLALDRGGACHGLLFRIEAAKVMSEARLLWRREMLAGSYEARWVRAHAERQHRSGHSPLLRADAMRGISAPSRSSTSPASFERARGRSARRVPISSPRCRRSKDSASGIRAWNGCGERSFSRIGMRCSPATRRVAGPRVEIGTTPAHVSKRSAAPKSQLGVRLFHRTTRRVVITEDGERASWSACAPQSSWATRPPPPPEAQPRRKSSFARTGRWSSR